MTKLASLPPLEEEAREILRILDLHWHRRYRPEQVREKLKALLLELKKILARDRADARFVVTTFRRLLNHQALQGEVEIADQVLKRMVAELSVVIVSVLPFAFVTLPGVLALADHMGIQLLPPNGEKERRGEQAGDTSSASAIHEKPPDPGGNLP